MTPDPSLPTDSRRDFVKKSIAATIIAAQPTILAGLIRAEGGEGGPTTTTVATTNGSKRLWRKYKRKLYIGGNDESGWILTPNINQAMSFTNEDLPSGPPPVGVNIPDVPTAGGFSLLEYFRQNTDTTEPLKEPFPTATTTRAPFAEAHPNVGVAKGFEIFVDYEWQYGAPD